MRILYYLEPWIEKQNAKYRKYSFSNQVLPLVRSLSNRYYDEVDIKIIVGDGVDKSFDKGVCAEYPAYDISVISQHDLRKCFSDYKKAVNLDYHKTFNSNQVKLFKNLLHEKIGDFVPDIVFSYESSINIFKEVYPNTLCLVEYFGAFSRLPFPVTLALDASGIYKDSYLYKYKSELNALAPSSEASSFMTEIRNIFFEETLSKYFIEPELFLNIRKKHKYIVLLPLQGSNYFAFEENVKYTNMLDYIMDVLDTIDPNIAVVVTEHTSREQIINDLNYYYLQKTYPNFYYFPEINNIPNHSPIFLKQVDGVIMVTSGVGFLAGILQKPVFQIGNCESFVSSGNKASDIFSFLETNKIVDKDAGFHHLFTHFYFTNEELTTPESLFALLKQLLKKHQESNNIFDYYPRKDTDTSILENLKKNNRNQELKISLDKNAYFKQKLPRIIQNSEIAKKDIQTISFDIFDTLLIRPFHQPHMLFAYMKPHVQELLGNPYFDFHECRVYAEKQARQSKQSVISEQFFYEITLDEIYLKLQEIFNITPEKASAIMEYELETEKKFLTLRPTVSDLYTQALNAKKKIILISDTYFPEYFIKSVLDKNGIKGYDALYLSSVYKTRKHDGTLFKLLIEQFSIIPKTTLHIGDNKFADKKQCEPLGFNCLRIPKSTDYLLESKNSFAELAKKTNFFSSHSAILAIIAHKYFNQETNKDLLESSFHGDAIELGFSGMGPLLLGYCLWLHENAVSDNVDCLFFLSRDGNIIKKVYDSLSSIFDKKIPTKYIRSSRRATVVANLKTKDDIYKALKAKIVSCTVQHIFEHRLGLVLTPDDEIHVQSCGFKHRFQIVDQLQDMGKIQKLVEIFATKIFDNAYIERQAYLKYLEEQDIRTDNTKNYAVVDIGYAGTIQKNLSEILDIKLNGYYLGTRDSAKNLIKNGFGIKGYLFNLDIINSEIMHPFNHYISLFETLFSCDESSFRCFKVENDALKEAYYDTDVEPTRKKLTIDIHKGALLFIDDMKKNFGKDLVNFSISKDYVLYPLLNFFKNPHPKDAQILEGVDIEETTAHMTTRIFIPVLSKYTSQELKSLKDLLIANSLWKIGTTNLINYMIKNKTKPKVETKAKDSFVKNIYNKKDINFRFRRKMDKFVNSPDEFFDDSSNKMVHLLKPFAKNIEQRRKIRKFVTNPYQFFDDSNYRFVRVLRFPFKYYNKN